MDADTTFVNESHHSHDEVWASVQDVFDLQHRNTMVSLPTQTVTEEIVDDYNFDAATLVAQLSEATDQQHHEPNYA